MCVTHARCCLLALMGLIIVTLCPLIVVGCRLATCLGCVLLKGPKDDTVYRYIHTWYVQNKGCRTATGEIVLLSTTAGKNVLRLATRSRGSRSHPDLVELVRPGFSCRIFGVSPKGARAKKYFRTSTNSCIYTYTLRGFYVVRARTRTGPGPAHHISECFGLTLSYRATKYNNSHTSVSFLADGDG